MENKTVWPAKYLDPKVELVGKRVKKTSASLRHLGYFGEREIVDYRYYEALIAGALRGIDEKIRSGRLVPMDTDQYPRVARYPDGVARVAIYIGSFDPFQLTHLTIALRMLAHEKSKANLVVVVPEGSEEARKPRKTEYAFRYQIVKAQLASILEPFVLPLDIGQNAGTIEIVRRFIALHTGLKLELTHVLGSDILPLAAQFLDEDLKAWNAEAAKSGVDYTHSLHITRRTNSGSLAEYLGRVRSRGVEAVLDRKIVGMPSSTNFRNDNAITIVLPTEAMREKLEIMFRYNMNRPWSASNRFQRTFPWEI